MGGVGGVGRVAVAWSGGVVVGWWGGAVVVGEVVRWSVAGRCGRVGPWVRGRWVEEVAGFGGVGGFWWRELVFPGVAQLSSRSVLLLSVCPLVFWRSCQWTCGLVLHGESQSTCCQAALSPPQ